MKKLLALLLAMIMVLSLAACGPTPEPTDPTTNPTTAPTTPGTDPTTEPTTEPTEPVEVGYVIGEAIQPDDASVAAKWTEEETEDGWIKITQEGGDTLGYSKNSGVEIIQVDGWAFKDLDRDGELDVYEDWRNDSETRARDLAAHMSGEEIGPLLTHGGWGTFTTEEITEDNSVYAYIVAGGRGGVTRNSGSTTESNVAHAQWANLIQELCESQMYGIPGVISIDPNGQSDMIQTLSLAATFSPEMALEVGAAYSEQYRAMGISMLLGPQVDLLTSPVVDRGTGTYGEDPALTRDIANGFVSGMQSTWAEDGTDLGWGSDSVITVMKHYAGAGAVEAGRDDHNEKYTVFENNNYEAHLIPFHDGAFNLTYSSTGQAWGVMTNYSISYSEDGSLGELVAGAYSEFKLDTLHQSGWDNFVVTDWGILSKCYGVTDEDGYDNASRHALMYKIGITQVGGSSDIQGPVEAYALLVDELGEEAALTLYRDRAATFIEMCCNLELFENPYCSTAKVRELNNTVEALEYGLQTQLASVVMLKNTNNLIKAAEDGAEKLTVYVPYVFSPAQAAQYASSGGGSAASWDPALDIEMLEKYYNVVTDSVGEPSGTDADGNAVYTEADVIRASADLIATCDLVLVKMEAPHTASSSSTLEDGTTIWTPPSIQYAEYTATTAKAESIAGDKVITEFFDGYTVQTTESTQNRSYKDQTAEQASNYGDLEMLQYVDSVVSCPIIVLMDQNGSGAMVWTEVEPLADAIITGYSVNDEALVMVAAGLYEPNGLLVAQMPASMEAVEAQTGEDTPRDLECYVDANGNTYDFAFGMNWSGVINDERVQTYGEAEPLTECESFDFQYAD